MNIAKDPAQCGVKEKEFPKGVTIEEKLTFLLRCAILAPSSHITHPWKFSVCEDEIQVFVDRTQWLKVADSDQRELYISVGCALEYLLIAAEHFGYGHQVSYFPEPGQEELTATVKFEFQGQPSLYRDSALFDAIPSWQNQSQSLRRTSHSPGRPATSSELLR